MHYFHIALIILFQFSLASQNLPTVSLRPKPKARAGGAAKKAAPIFSVPFK